MRNKCKYRTACVELNGTNEFNRLPHKQDGFSFTYKNIDFYPCAVMSTLTNIFNMKYERIIIDFGLLNVNTLKEFRRCDSKLVICPHGLWKNNSLEKLFTIFSENNINVKKDFKLIMNLVEKNSFSDMETFPYLENPFLLTSNNFELLEKITERN